MPNKKACLNNWVEAQLKIDNKVKPSINNYGRHHVIGKGGFGKVWRV